MRLHIQAILGEIGQGFALLQLRLDVRLRFDVRLRLDVRRLQIGADIRSAPNRLDVNTERTLWAKGQKHASLYIAPQSW